MFRKKTHIHFVGIGGIGMSAIAKVLIQRGYVVSGCDNNVTQKSVIDLRTLGCHVHQGNNQPLCDDHSINVLVYTSDVNPLHPEIVRARERGIAVISRGQMLAELTRTKYTIGIAGSHGKTTTTSLIAHIFIQAQLDPTVIVGGHLKSISSNGLVGNSEFLITETDESDRSLLYLFPTIAVLTNIDREHLNTYRNLQDITETFRRFLQKVPFYGKAIVCVDDLQIHSLLPLDGIPTTTYGKSAQAEWSYNDLTLHADHSTYELIYKGVALGYVKVPIAGHHNVLNSIAALAASLETGMSFDTASRALATFCGVDRRFTFRGIVQGAEIFDDYGHHPTEISCTSLVARKRARNKLIVVFQPHRYSRMSTLWKEFVELLATYPADHILVTDLYSASEAVVPGITSQALVAQAKQLNPTAPVTYVPFEPDFKSLHAAITSLASEGDLILLQGAGNVTHLSAVLLTPPTTQPQTTHQKGQ